MNLSGRIPSALGNMANLTDLRLHDNQLSGPIPPEIGNLSKLEWLDFSGNNLSGDVPVTLKNLTNLRTLYLTGSYPKREKGNENLCLPGELHTWVQTISSEKTDVWGKTTTGAVAFYLKACTDTPVTGSPEEDRAALVAFYKATGGG